MNNGNWVTKTETPAAEEIIESVIPGEYDVSVVAINRFGKASAQSSASVLVDTTNPLAGATVTGLEIAGQGSVTDYSTADVQFAWRINSPANAAQALGGDDARFDPFFEAFLVTICNADTGAVIQAMIPVTQPTYDFTLDKNKNTTAGPHPRYKIGVAILDKFKNVSAEAFLTVNKLAPLPPVTPDNLIPTIGGANPQWTNQPDVSRKQNNIYMDIAPDSLNAGNLVAVTAADSSQKAIDGITTALGSQRAFWVQAEDVFGLKSTLLFLGYVVPGRVNDIAEVTFHPDGGALESATSPDNLVQLTHPDPDAQIWFRVDSTDLPSNNPADGSVLYFDGLIGINDPTASVIAAAFVRGLWGPATTREFTTNTGGGGGGGSDAAVSPSFDPPSGTYYDESGEKDITAISPAADNLFYTTDGTTPAQEGSLNPTGTTLKVTGDTLNLTLSRGPHTIKVFAHKTGFLDSTVSTGSYRVIQSIGGA